MQCEFCGEPFHQLQISQRFCCRVCSDAFFQAERRFAVLYVREHNIPVPVPATEQRT
jgi:hypothetical protein